MAALPILLGAGLCVLNSRELSVIGDYLANLYVESSRSFLLAGIPGCTALDMPLLGTVLSAALNLGMTPVLLFVILHLLVYTLVFCSGCLLRGYWAGILSLGGTGLLEAGGMSRSGYDVEQSFYGIILLLVMALLLLKRREDTLKNDLMAGLAVGASLLVRSPLFLFPPILIICGWLCGERSRAYLMRSMVFLAASYVLLIPWNVFTYSTFGGVDIFEVRRGEDNVITGAMGSIYTAEGDTRKLAGLKEDESAFGFYLRKISEAPLFFLMTVLKRCWHIFLFYPELFGSFLLALLLNRDKKRRYVFTLPVYFIGIHALLSIDRRYFYPMLYILPPIIVGSLLPRRFAKGQDCGVFAGKTVTAVFWLSLCVIIGMEALIIVYPYRAAQNNASEEAFSRALDRFPNDMALQEINCRQLLYRADYSVHHKYGGDYSGYFKCRCDYGAKFNNRVNQYFCSVIVSRSPSELSLPQDADWELKDCLIARMLREYELGESVAAMGTFRQAYALYDAGWNQVREKPYERDREIEAVLKRDAGRFWNVHVSPVIRMWPLERRVKILSRLEKYFALPGEFKMLAASLPVPYGNTLPDHGRGGWILPNMDSK